jgi:hypothetical protein
MKQVAAGLPVVLEHEAPPYGRQAQFSMTVNCVERLGFHSDEDEAMRLLAAPFLLDVTPTLLLNSRGKRNLFIAHPFFRSAYGCR